MYREILIKSYKDFMLKTFGHKKDIYNFLSNHETFDKAIDWTSEQFVEVKKRNLSLDKDTVALVGKDFCRVWCLAVLNKKEAELKEKFTTAMDFEKDDNVIKKKLDEEFKDKMKSQNWDKLMKNKEKREHVKQYQIGSDPKREKAVETVVE